MGYKFTKKYLRQEQTKRTALGMIIKTSLAHLDAHPLPPAYPLNLFEQHPVMCTALSLDPGSQTFSTNVIPGMQIHVMYNVNRGL